MLRTSVGEGRAWEGPSTKGGEGGSTGMEVGGDSLGGVASSEGVVRSEEATSSESSVPREGGVVSGERSLPWELASGEVVLTEDLEGLVL